VQHFEMAPVNVATVVMPLAYKLLTLAIGNETKTTTWRKGILLIWLCRLEVTQLLKSCFEEACLRVT